ncbi:hypothetical protein F8A87_13555 [Betaproteobacteria bacterium SCN2]|jgi:hypothetical protein|nr:hypothetical protein F8A87_13555 [Betaproteobacteria bacterium SCN2]
MSSEFEYLAELADDFFSQPHTQQSLSLIHQHNISGWEIWLQVELGHFLSMHESEPEWRREEALEYDRRLERTKQYLRPDFLIRKKGWKKESYLALELKQHRNAPACLANRAKDIVKLDKLRQSSIDLRSCWVLGVFERESKADLNELIADTLESVDYDYDPEYVVNKYIWNTPFGYCIF